MRDPASVLLSYQATVQSQQIVLDFLQRTSKAQMFHGTVFHAEPYTQIQEMMGIAGEDLYDLFIVLLVATFEHVLFNHPNSPLEDELERQGKEGVKGALASFENKVSPKLYKAIVELCDYRDWVAHGKRWTPIPPKPATVEVVSRQLEDFLVQANLNLPSSTEL